MSSSDKEYYISANQINMGLQCPFKLALYRQKVPVGERDMGDIACGQAVHAFMEDLGRNNTNPDESYYIKGLYESDPAKRVVVPLDRLDKMRQSIAYGRKNYSGIDYKSETSFEKHFTTPKGRKVVLIGRIDAMTDDYIWDWKTSKPGKVDSEDHRRAAAIYDFATDFTHKHLVYVSLFAGEAVEFAHMTAEYVPNLCDAFIDRLEKHDFLRVHNSKSRSFNRCFPCAWCEYRDDYCFENAENLIVPKLTVQEIRK